MQTGGVTLVLGAAYLTLQAHQRNRLAQAETLRAQTYILNSLSYIPASAPPPKTIAEELALLEYQQSLLSRAEARRAGRLGTESFLERAKERWNAEIENAVRWTTTKDWTAAREDAEVAAARAWARLTGGEVAPAPAPATAQHSVEKTKAAAAAVADKATAAAVAAKSTAQQTAVRTKDTAQAKAVEASEAATSIWERGFRRSKEVAAKAKAVVGLAEEKAQQKVTELESDVEKAMRQRYERRPEDSLNESVEEVLAERYKPVAQQDHSKLRGL